MPVHAAQVCAAAALVCLTGLRSVVWFFVAVIPKPGVAWPRPTKKKQSIAHLFAVSTRLNPTVGLAALTAAIVMLCVGCTRIETGEVGMRINLDKTTDPAELVSGLF